MELPVNKFKKEEAGRESPGLISGAVLRHAQDWRIAPHTEQWVA